MSVIGLSRAGMAQVLKGIDQFQERVERAEADAQAVTDLAIAFIVLAGHKVTENCEVCRKAYNMLLKLGGDLGYDCGKHRETHVLISGDQFSVEVRQYTPDHQQYEILYAV